MKLQTGLTIFFLGPFLGFVRSLSSAITKPHLTHEKEPAW